MSQLLHPRHIDGKAHAISLFSSVRNFVQSPTVPPGFISIWEQGMPIDILAQNRGYDTTVIFMHGAIAQDHVLPVTGGLGISSDLPVNRIFVTDPSLYMSPELRLSWFAGNKFQRLQQLLGQVLGKIADSYKSKRIVFFGTSGGGFASLFYSTLFPGSRAIVVNPQTNIEHYETDPVRKFLSTCFDLDTNSSIDKLPSDVCYDLNELYSDRMRNSVAYVQNSDDSFHIKNHMNLFMEELNPINDVSFLVGNGWDKGHTPPPKSILKKIILAATVEDWTSELNLLGFNGVSSVRQSLASRS